MDPATIALIIQSLPIAIQAINGITQQITEMVDTLGKAQEEGRDITDEERARFAAISDSWLAIWQNRAGGLPPSP